MIEQYFTVENEVAVNLSPPVPRFEPAPEQRPGFIWIHGFWDWQNERHTWVDGRWEFERHGFRWLGHRWVERHGRWYLQPGGWTRLSELESLNAAAPRGVVRRYDFTSHLATVTA